jgi:hypothetical protein
MKSTESVKQKINFMEIEGVKVYDTAYTFSQEADTWQEDSDNGQDLKVETRDSGGGSYIVISTDRWAIDYGDIDKFAACLKRICETPEK